MSRNRVIQLGLLVAAVALLGVTMIVYAAPPADPVPTSPGDGETVNTNAPLFNWTGDAGAETYKLVIKDAANNRVFKGKYTAADACSGTACSVSPGAQDITFRNGDYTWRVVAKNADGKGKSAKASFTVDFPGTPVLTSPADGATVNTMPILVWEEVIQADQYRIKAKRAGDGEKFKSGWLTAFSLCTPTCQYVFLDPFEPGTYTWKVLARQETFRKDKSKSEKRTFVVPAN